MRCEDWDPVFEQTNRTWKLAFAVEKILDNRMGCFNLGCAAYDNIFAHPALVRPLRLQFNVEYILILAAFWLGQWAATELNQGPAVRCHGNTIRAPNMLF
mmetsp:Transcript_25781/g.59500  ORF Transcript_25781/g.59500 Transcript_25781/m.59500 type:complete len:100 (+) Transcript_25781:376-675(+)